MAFVGSLSGSGGASNTINVTGSMIIANPGTGGLFPLFPGTDTVFFVSGAIDGKSAGSRTVSVFGGDVVASGSITIGTGSIRIDSNEIRFQGGIAKITSGSGGLTFFDSGTPSGVTLTSLTAGAGGGDVDGPATATDNAIARFDQTTGKVIQDSVVTISDESAGAVTIAGSSTTVNLFNTTATTVSFAGGASTATNIGNASGLTTIAGDLKVAGNNIQSSTGATAITLSGGNVIIPGDLTVNGTTTTVNTANLVVKDQLIYIASSSAAGTVTYGGLAIASGSGTTNEALVFVKDGTGTGAVWSAGRQDVASGSVTTNAGLTYLPIRASSFQLGGTLGSAVAADSAYLSSSDALNVLVNHKSSTTFATNEVPTFKIGTFDPVGPDPEVGAIFGMGGTLAAPVISSLWISGTRVDLAHSLASATSGVGIVGGDMQGGLLRITKSGVTPTFNVEGRDGSGAPRDLVMTGSTITIGANSSATGITFAGANTAFANLSAASSTTPSFVASQTNATFKVGTGGGTTDALILSGTAIQLSSGGAEYLRFTSSTGLGTLIGGQVAGRNVSLTAAGAGKMILSGSTTTLSGSSIDFVNDSTKVAFFGTSGNSSGLIPNVTNTFDLGTPDLRWRNMYTGDLHLKNERGDWTVIEEEDFLTLTNNKSGKRYKFVLEEI